MIFIATKNSLSSRECVIALEYAKKYGLKILPILGNNITRKDLIRIDLTLQHWRDAVEMGRLQTLEFNANINDNLCKIIIKNI